MKKINLFCIPNAGGTASVYFKWKKYLNDQINLIPLELCGRGKYYNKPLYNSLQEYVDDIFVSIRKELNGDEYAIFGHSMGSILSYEVIRKLKRENLYSPVHAFFSGRYPPHIKKNMEYFHKMPDEEFINELIKIGGTPKDFFNNKELLNIFLPILRADYKIIELYEYIPENLLFEFDITVFNGKKDKDVSFDEMLEWKKYSNKKFNIHEFDAGHFFINEKTEEVVNLINKYLMSNK